MKEKGGIFVLCMSLLLVAFTAYPISAQQRGPGMQEQDERQQEMQQPGMQQEREMQQPGTQQDDMQRGMQQPGTQQDDMQRGMQQPGTQQDGMQQPGAQQRQEMQQPGMQQQAGQDAPITIGPSTLSQIQQNLNDQGHDAGPVDGLWGPQTAEGIQSFQKAEGLSPTGNLNMETLQALGMDDFSDQQMQQAAQDQVGQNAESTQLHISPSELAQIQQRLNDEGFDAGPVDGMMGPQTSNAIREYQQAQDVPPTGNVDVNLIENLGLGQLVAGLTGTGAGVVKETGMFPGQDQQQTGQTGQTGQVETEQDEARGYFGQDQAAEDQNDPRYRGEGAPLFAGPATVRQIQEALSETGHDPGEADGTWGPETQEALRSYQEEQQLEPTGNLTIATMQQLMGALDQQPMQPQQEQPTGTQQDQPMGTQQPGTTDQQVGTPDSPGTETQQPPGTMQTPAPGTMDTPGGAQQSPGTGTDQRQ